MVLRPLCDCGIERFRWNFGGDKIPYNMCAIGKDAAKINVDSHNRAYLKIALSSSYALAYMFIICHSCPISEKRHTVR